MGKVTKKGRLKATAGLGEFINSEKMRLFDGATPERQAQFRRAERRHVIFQAWNKVCAGTREGKHVTGLHYVAERDELIVYTDGASWTQELTMMREIIRARMDACAGAVVNIVVKTTRPGFVDGPREKRDRPRLNIRAKVPAIGLSGACRGSRDLDHRAFYRRFMR